MLDFVRVGIRTAVITATFVALGLILVGLYNLVGIIPVPSIGSLTDAFRIGLFFLNKYAQPLVWCVAFVGALIAFKISLYVAYLANLASSWILRIFS